MLMKGPEKKTAQMCGPVRLRVHWMKTSGQGGCVGRGGGGGGGGRRVEE